MPLAKAAVTWIREIEPPIHPKGLRGPHRYPEYCDHIRISHWVRQDKTGDFISLGTPKKKLLLRLLPSPIALTSLRAYRGQSVPFDNSITVHYGMFRLTRDRNKDKSQ